MEKLLFIKTHLKVVFKSGEIIMVWDVPGTFHQIMDSTRQFDNHFFYFSDHVIAKSEVRYIEENGVSQKEVNVERQDDV